MPKIIQYQHLDNKIRPSFFSLTWACIWSSIIPVYQIWCAFCHPTIQFVKKKYKYDVVVVEFWWFVFIILWKKINKILTCLYKIILNTGNYIVFCNTNIIAHQATIYTRSIYCGLTICYKKGHNCTLQWLQINDVGFGVAKSLHTQYTQIKDKWLYWPLFGVV